MQGRIKKGMVFSMEYQSTRDSAVRVSSAQAITQGISREGGLFVPESLPVLSPEDYRSLAKKSYVERADAVLSRFLTDFTGEEIASCTRAAYTSDRFGSADVAPLHSLDDRTHILELWHGPTCAFKDMALQILPHLMRVSAGKTADGKEIVILVATSGDTGKAALEGFRDAPHTRILVFYPEQGVSPMQKLQMITQEGANVAVCAIRGNFDDAQSGVKHIFTDPAVARKLETQGMMFSSANSINWGRLVPQVVYYVSAYCDLLASGRLREGQGFHVVVPTGNFGNILAAYYAKQMGLPIGKLICASNENKVLYDFFATGTYDKNREFVLTSSPSMDILVSSNLERLIYRIAGGNADETKTLMDALSRGGKYEITPEMRDQLADFYGNYASEDEVAATISRIYREDGYVLDTHTAVAAVVYGKYTEETGDRTKTVIASTASPYKFARSVLHAIDREKYDPMQDMEQIDALAAVSGVKVPEAIEEIRTAPVRHHTVAEVGGMEAAVKKILGLTD